MKADFEKKVKEMVQKFLWENGFDLEDYNGDVNEAIWEQKDVFGEVAYNIICEWMGDEEIQEMADEILEENKEDEKDE